tara:strand:- start:426 stop:1637 length:1212 start_codon:yes stop_codon:yes gene_type:complete
MNEKKPGPLQGLKVIELAHIMAGPVCGLMLADMGADVIKVERVPSGDDSRFFTPPEIDGESAAFMMMNRNKRGIAIDLKSEAGVEVLKTLLKTADVVTENYRRGTMEKLGLKYDALRKSNPGLIYCEISGFGRTGPYRDRPGFDLIAQGMSGLMAITGEAPGKAPCKVGAPVTDITAGILGALGIVAAYTNRLKTGIGDKVDTSLFEAGIIHTYWQSAIALATGVSPQPMGSAHPLNGPYQAFPTADGWITVGAANQANWKRLLMVLEVPELAADSRFHDNSMRMKHRKKLETILSDLFRQQTSSFWLKKLERGGVPAGPVLDICQMHSDPQVKARQMVIDINHSKIGSVPTIGLPIKFTNNPGEITSGAPLYGEHTREVLREYNYSEKEIADLIDVGVAIAC